MIANERRLADVENDRERASLIQRRMRLLAERDAETEPTWARLRATSVGARGVAAVPGQTDPVLIAWEAAYVHRTLHGTGPCPLAPPYPFEAPCYYPVTREAHGIRVTWYPDPDAPALVGRWEAYRADGGAL